MDKQKYKNYLREVEQKIGTVNNAIPHQRSAYKQGYSFSGAAFEEQAQIWDYIWKHSKIYRAQVHAFFFIENHLSKKELAAAIWNITESWQEQVNGWGLCDALAKIYTKMLETEPAKVYKRLKEWNKDPNLWKRRQSLVSLLYYSRTKKTHLPFQKIIVLVKPLLKDKEYYVQKGLGWCLRETHNAYPEQAYQFMKENIKNISGIAFTIAIEKMNKKQKDELKGMRKK
jgi:3-methyladenine DNA glycosylase AlkD